MVIFSVVSAAKKNLPPNSPDQGWNDRTTAVNPVSGNTSGTGEKSILNTGQNKEGMQENTTGGSLPPRRWTKSPANISCSISFFLHIAQVESISLAKIIDILPNIFMDNPGYEIHNNEPFILECIEKIEKDIPIDASLFTSKTESKIHLAIYICRMLGGKIKFPKSENNDRKIRCRYASYSNGEFNWVLKVSDEVIRCDPLHREFSEMIEHDKKENPETSEYEYIEV